MRADSVAETFSIENGVARIAFDLSGSAARYLVISVPEAGGGAEAEFFGQSHHVEVKDQLFGRYGGLRAIRAPSGSCVEVQLAFEVPDVGTRLSISTSAPLTEPALSYIRKLGCA